MKNDSYRLIYRKRFSNSIMMFKTCKICRCSLSLLLRFLHFYREESQEKLPMQSLESFQNYPVKVCLNIAFVRYFKIRNELLLSFAIFARVCSSVIQFSRPPLENYLSSLDFPRILLMSRFIQGNILSFLDRKSKNQCMLCCIPKKIDNTSITCEVFSFLYFMYL